MEELIGYMYDPEDDELTYKVFACARNSVMNYRIYLGEFTTVESITIHELKKVIHQLHPGSTWNTRLA